MCVCVCELAVHKRKFRVPFLSSCLYTIHNLSLTHTHTFILSLSFFPPSLSLVVTLFLSLSLSFFPPSVSFFPLSPPPHTHIITFRLGYEPDSGDNFNPTSSSQANVHAFFNCVKKFQQDLQLPLLHQDGVLNEVTLMKIKESVRMIRRTGSVA